MERDQNSRHESSSLPTTTREAGSANASSQSVAVCQGRNELRRSELPCESISSLPACIGRQTGYARRYLTGEIGGDGGGLDSCPQGGRRIRSAGSGLSARASCLFSRRCEGESVGNTLASHWPATRNRRDGDLSGPMP